MTVPKITFL